MIRTLFQLMRQTNKKIKKAKLNIGMSLPIAVDPLNPKITFILP